MKDTDKVTLTVAQLKKLVTEAKAKKQKVNEEKFASDADWSKADRKLKPVKREIAQKAKELYKQLKAKFISSMTKDFVKNNISYESDSPSDAAENLFYDLGHAPASTISELVSLMYLFDD